MTKFTYQGQTIRMSLPELGGNVRRKLNSGRFYEQKFLEYIAGLDLQGLYVDIGGNVGNHSVYFANFTAADAVISLEPHREIFEFLKTNVENNDPKQKVTPENIAAGDRNGRCSLSEDARDPLGGSFVTKGDDIEMRVLDDIVGARKVSLVKIDVEGFETSVLKGAGTVLQRDQPELFIEATAIAEKRAVDAILRPYGYTAVNVYNNSATYHYSTKLKRNPLTYFVTSPYPVRRLIRYS